MKKYYGNLRRARDYVLTGILGLGFLVGCGGGGHKDKNLQPSIFIEKEFPNNGTVKYTVRGIDEDGDVEIIETSFNNEKSVLFNGDSYEVSKEIVQRGNSFNARVQDNEGTSTKDLDNFNVSNYREFYGHVRAILDNANAIYLTGNFPNEKSDIPERIPYFINHDPVFVDFIIERESERFSVIKYADITDSLEEIINEERRLNSVLTNADGTKNLLFLYRLPLEEIGKRVRDFVDNGYKR